RRWCAELLRDLPDGVDPCGENGEMHTIVVDGPMFQKRLEVQVGQVVQRNGFAYADIIPIR
ncbi:MAG: ATP-binding protein, partial [Deltaproteobacteria bacterium]|nr:ATP-binding protein [Deltaproteobacteria bacterium]